MYLLKQPKTLVTIKGSLKLYKSVHTNSAIDFKIISRMGVQDIQNSIRDKKIIYDYSADSKGIKQANFGKLKRLDLNSLPDYMSKNINQFSEWID